MIIQIKEEELFNGEHPDYFNTPMSDMAVYKETSNTRRRLFVQEASTSTFTNVSNKNKEIYFNESARNEVLVEDDDGTNSRRNDFKSNFPLNLSEKSTIANCKDNNKKFANNYDQQQQNSQQDYDGFVNFIADEFRRLSPPKKIELKKKILRAIIECQDE